MSVRISPRNRTHSHGDPVTIGQDKSNMNCGGQSRSQRRTLFQKILSNNRSLNRSTDSTSSDRNPTAQSSLSTDGVEVDVTPRIAGKAKSASPIDSQGDHVHVQVKVAAKFRDASRSSPNHCEKVDGNKLPESARDKSTSPRLAVLSPSRRLLEHERDGFCIAVDSYDGHTIYVDGTAAYEISTYLGGGVAGVVYEGRRLVPFHQHIHRNSGGFMRENSVLRDDFYSSDDHGDLEDRASSMCRTPIAYFCEPNLQESGLDDLALEVDSKTVRNGDYKLSVLNRFAETIGRRRNRNDPQFPVVGESDEDVAIKILNPIGFRLQSPSTCSTATIVQEGLPLDEDIRNGLCPMTEKNVWWLVSPTSRSLKAYLDSARQISSVSTPANDNGDPVHSFLDRGSPQKGIRMSMIAAYLDPKTGLLHELPLPKCIEIWGHAPFGSTEKEFDEMMDAIEKINDGQALPERFTIDANMVQHPSGLLRATVAKINTIYCAHLDAYISVPAIPPKYLRWLRQRRAVTKEIRNMLRLGRHKNVVHLYEVLELIQDSKSIMFLVLELVRGGELFELISVNAKEGANGKSSAGTEDDEAVMFNFFKELVSGIAYCHTHGVAHRDLKPENLLVHNGFNGERILKIADFGLSAPFSAHLRRKEDDAWDRLPLCGDGFIIERSNISSPVHSSNSLPTSPGPVTGLSPIVISHVNSLKALGSAALSFLTCGNLENVTECIPRQNHESMTNASPLARMKSVVGSPHYVAPEIICRVNEKEKGITFDESGYDGTKADVWSAGVILYAMLFRSLPFGEDLLRCPRFQSFSKWYDSARRNRGRRQSSFAALLPLSLKSDNDDLGPPWFFPSKGKMESKDLIVAMLNPDPKDRLSIEQVLCHPWLKSKLQ